MWIVDTSFDASSTPAERGMTLSTPNLIATFDLEYPGGAFGAWLSILGK